MMAFRVQRCESLIRRRAPHHLSPLARTRKGNGLPYGIPSTMEHCAISEVLQPPSSRNASMASASFGVTREAMPGIRIVFS